MVRRILAMLLAVGLSSALFIPTGAIAAGSHPPTHAHTAKPHKGHKHRKHGSQRVAIQRGDCMSTGTGNFGFAQINVHKNGGATIEASLKGAMPNTSYRLYVLGPGSTSCGVLYADGSTTTNAQGNGNIHADVPAGTIPAGQSVRIQLVAPATATVPGSGPFTDILTSTATTA